MRQRSLLLPLLLALSCTAPTEGHDPGRSALDPRPGPAVGQEGSEDRVGDLVDPLAPPPWTDAFEGRAVLMAERVRVEGPAGLITHCVVEHDLQRFVHETRTTTEGLVQRTLRRREDLEADPLRGIRAQLDGLRIEALFGIEVLERPGPVDVVLEARGDVWWRDPATGEERRGEQLRLVGSAPGDGDDAPDREADDR